VIVFNFVVRNYLFITIMTERVSAEVPLTPLKLKNKEEKEEGKEEESNMT